jgi:hypothetical protein
MAKIRKSKVKKNVKNSKTKISKKIRFIIVIVKNSKKVFNHKK